MGFVCNRAVYWDLKATEAKRAAPLTKVGVELKDLKWKSLRHGRLLCQRTINFRLPLLAYSIGRNALKLETSIFRRRSVHTSKRLKMHLTVAHS